MLHIGICDDNQKDISRVQELAVRFSEQHPEMPVQIQAYSSPYDLLDDIEKTGGFDLYLLDVVMPHMTGVTLARRIRERKERAEILFLTVSKEYAVEAFSVKASGYLIKPVNQSAFEDAVLDCIHRLSPENNPSLLLKSKDGIQGYNTALLEIEKMIALINDQRKLPVLEADKDVKFKCNVTKEEYCRMIEKTKHYIKEGDIFQGVISRRFVADYKSSLINAYRVLRTTNPSPYMYFIQSDDLQIAGASPETMVKLVDGKLTTFPVAGTRPRGVNDEQDKTLEKELLADEKELAEHNMLVDLARNDMGRIAKYGSVYLEDYMKIHRFSKVMHIASTVCGQIRDDKDGCDTVAALLPAGTLSGAPKFRACQIIDELEKEPRGVYGGAIGYIDLSGNLDVCIAIRTAVKKENKVYVQAGAGIVADSVPESEYMECAHKAGAVIDAIKRGSEVNG